MDKGRQALAQETEAIAPKRRVNGFRLTAGRQCNNKIAAHRVINENFFIREMQLSAILDGRSTLAEERLDKPVQLRCTLTNFNNS